ncbi:MAG: exodeoxyribonuclease I, partial [Pseudomonadota bacterium]|nr:exodeoxyribonuclease I [Pseudomonadota bacterium]
PVVIEQHAASLRDAGPALVEKVRRVFAVESDRTPADVDAALYDGFIGDGDKRLFRDVRTTPPQALGERHFDFRDPRMPELLFRYRARNWPDTLSADEQSRWDDYRRSRLQDDHGLSEHTFETFDAELSALRVQQIGDGSALALLDQLQMWRQEVERSLR